MSLFKCSVVIITLTLTGIVYADDTSDKKTPAEIISVTEANLLGHKSLYKEGWFIVSSSEKAFSYAKEHSITASGDAMSRAIHDTKAHSAEYGKDLQEAGMDGMQLTKQIFNSGTELSREELKFTGKLIRNEWDYGSENLSLAWQRFVKGNMTLSERTEEDRQALTAVPGDWFKSIKSDFHNINELAHSATDAMSPHIEGRWGEAFDEARESFSLSYEKSGTRGNSLSGLGDIMAGYGKAIFSGVVKPATRSTVQGATVTVKGVSKLVFLPVASVFIVSGRTIQSTGLGLYYTTSMGVKLVSPTVEGGLLTGLSMLSYGAIPVTAVAGGAVGAVNQVAVTVASPVAGAGKTAVVAAADTGVYAAQVSYDLIKGVTKVTLNQAQSGIVLGYNALTALPTQLLLGTANGIVFLAYDGPRLVVASVKGEVQWSNKDGVKGSIPVQSLPVGSVVDLSAMSREPGMHVEIISDDPAVVQKVLEKLPEDLHVGERS
jgi:hypothetical protein